MHSTNVAKNVDIDVLLPLVERSEDLGLALGSNALYGPELMSVQPSSRTPKLTDESWSFLNL